MQSQQRVLANQILIRKVSRQLEAAESVEASWRILSDLVKALDFDGVTCRLSGWPNGSAPFLSGWSRCSGDGTNGCWSLSIPLHAGESTVGELHLWRALHKDRLLFQLSSFLETLVPLFEKQLKRHFEDEETPLIAA
jgi:hypothetical protein